MIRILTATEVEATILALLDDVAAGDEVEITKHGRVVARMVPAHGSHRLGGTLAGTARSAAADDGLFTTGASWTLGVTDSYSARTSCTGGPRNLGA